MKTLLSVLAGFIAVVGACAQGTVNFANTASTLVTYDSGGGGVPPGQFTAQLLYWATNPGFVNLNSSLAGFTSIKTTANFVSPGRFIGGTAVTPNTTAGGGNAWFAVVVWSTSAGSYDAARTAVGYTYGFSSIFQNATANPNSVPPSPPAQLSGFNGISVPVPEPTVILLSVMSGIVLVLFRARKQAARFQPASPVLMPFDHLSLRK